jgi:hypothetical protein
MRKVISKDGTPIAFEQSGEGPPIILVVGAFNDSSTFHSFARTIDREVSCSCFYQILF